MSKIEKNKVGWGIFLFFFLWFGHEIFSNKGEVVINRGVSFGFDVPLFLVAGLLVGWVFVFLKKGYKSDFFWSFWGLLVGGGINFLDRLKYGGVRDYFNFFGLFYNNLADWVIFVSVFSFAGLYFIKERKNEKK